jgi:hypothetical protein
MKAVTKSNPVLDKIWRVREELTKKHGGLDGYFEYIQKLDLARRRRDNNRLPKEHIDGA